MTVIYPDPNGDAAEMTAFYWHYSFPQTDVVKAMRNFNSIENLIAWREYFNHCERRGLIH